MSARLALLLWALAVCCAPDLAARVGATLSYSNPFTTSFKLGNTADTQNNQPASEAFNWNSPNFALSNPSGSFADTADVLRDDEWSRYLRVRDFGFTGTEIFQFCAAITGVTAKVTAANEDLSATNKDPCRFRSGTLITYDNSNAETSLGGLVIPAGSGIQSYQFGGAQDLWGSGGLTWSAVTDQNFGWGVSLQGTNSNDEQKARVYLVELAVSWTMPDVDISAINPTSGTVGQQVQVYCSGSKFFDLTGYSGEASPLCRFGSTEVLATIDSPSQITCTAPAGGPGAVTFEISLDGGNYTSNGHTFTYPGGSGAPPPATTGVAAPPATTGVSPPATTGVAALPTTGAAAGLTTTGASGGASATLSSSSAGSVAATTAAAGTTTAVLSTTSSSGATATPTSTSGSSSSSSSSATATASASASASSASTGSSAEDTSSAADDGSLLIIIIVVIVAVCVCLILVVAACVVVKKKKSDADDLAAFRDDKRGHELSGSSVSSSEVDGGDVVVYANIGDMQSAEDTSSDGMVDSGEVVYADLKAFGTNAASQPESSSDDDWSDQSEGVV